MHVVAVVVVALAEAANMHNATHRLINVVTTCSVKRDNLTAIATESEIESTTKQCNSVFVCAKCEKWQLVANHGVIPSFVRLMDCIMACRQIHRRRLRSNV